MMKFPLRTVATFVAALSCLSVCPSLYAGNAALEVSTPPAPQPVETATIPGPLRSFLRMAAVSQKVPASEVMPLLARNIFMQGYQRGNPTEYPLPRGRSVQQAREPQIPAGAANTIHVANCDDAGTLVQILGYRLREGCGQKNVSLETAQPERAFLTIDSGFPLVELEEALQKGAPFTYSFPATRVSVLYKESDWLALRAGE